MRILIKGDSVDLSGSQVRLGFKGRSYGDYTISKVSVAEKGVNEGDVVDATWTKVTFDSEPVSTWETHLVTVPKGGEQRSDCVEFSFDQGKNYYVTFQIKSPSVCLSPASYTELYFDDSVDHTEVLDWSGYNASDTLHALSTIFVEAQ